MWNRTTKLSKMDDLEEKWIDAEDSQEKVNAIENQ